MTPPLASGFLPLYLTQDGEEIFISVLGLTISRLGRGLDPKRFRAGKTRRIEDISNTAIEILGFIPQFSFLG